MRAQENSAPKRHVKIVIEMPVCLKLQLHDVPFVSQNYVDLLRRQCMASSILVSRSGYECWGNGRPCLHPILMFTNEGYQIASMLRHISMYECLGQKQVGKRSCNRINVPLLSVCD